MGMRHHASLPRPTVHKRTGYARLRLGGKEYWLGPAGSQEADQRYAQHLAAWAASGCKSAELPPPQAAQPAATSPMPATAPAPTPITLAATHSTPVMTVGGLMLRYLASIKGNKTAEELRGCSKWWNARVVANALETRRAVPLDRFGPKMLKDVQSELASRPKKQRQDGEAVMLTRYMVNRTIKEIVAMFAWAVGEELVPADRLVSLRCVKSLRAGESLARESVPVSPVSDNDIEAILPHLPPVVADLVRFARLTAVRPSEACRLRTADIDTGDNLPAPRWTLEKHKTAHKGKVREIAIGPRARQIIERWAAGKSPTDPVFATGDLGRARTSGTIAKRKRRTKRNAFTSTDIRKDIAAACRAAGLPTWTTYQLRHAGLSDVRRKMGLEAAQAHGGHATAKMTEHYARLTFQDAARVALKIG
jgi:integrase